MAKNFIFLLIILCLLNLIQSKHLKVQLSQISRKSYYNSRPTINLAQIRQQFNDPDHEAGWNGTFDNKVVLSNSQNEAGAVYVGTIYISDASSPLRLIFDTGSDYLAITSDLCKDKKYADEDVALFDVATRADSSGDGAALVQKKSKGGPPHVESIMLNDNTEEAAAEIEKGKEKPRCDTMAYTTTGGNGKEAKEDDVTLNYGSAHFKGRLFTDKICIDPLQNRCSNQFQFLALYQAQGLGSDIDGILGLANHKDSAKRHLNFVWSLKDNKVIDKAVISFSVASNESYALFGDYNVTQVVGGAKGLHSLKTFAYLPDFIGANKNWALEGQNLMYGAIELKNVLEGSFPAIIDTGSSTLGVPAKMYDQLKKEWEKAVKDKLDCQSSDDFCQINGDTCANVGKGLQPIGFVMNGLVFEVPPSIYLFQGEGRCQFGIYKNDLGGDSMNMFIIGEPLLKNLYIVYDLENEEIKLGVNRYSAGTGVIIYKVGERPVAEAPQSLAEATAAAAEPESSGLGIETSTI